MTRTYDVNEAIRLVFKDRWICPECIDHIQGDSSIFYDCKNVFVNDDGKPVGQCCCYSESHGKREK